MRFKVTHEDGDSFTITCSSLCIAQDEIAIGIQSRGWKKKDCHVNKV